MKPWFDIYTKNSIYTLYIYIYMNVPKISMDDSNLLYVQGNKISLHDLL